MGRSVALAVDLGASGGRVVSGAFDGQVLELEEIHRFENFPIAMGGQLVWDMPRLWHEVQTGLRAAAGRHGQSVASVGVDTWGVDFAFLNEDQTLLANPVCYRDARNVGMVNEAQAIVPRQEIFQATGLQFIDINSLYQLLAIKKEQPCLLESANRMLMVPDLVHWLLTGEQTNERTDASTTQCLNPLTNDWSWELIDKFGLPRKIFGPIINPGSDLGGLRSEVAADTGLQNVRVIVPGTHDTASAVAAVPALEPPASRPDWCYVSLGTWALVGAELNRPLVTEECLSHNFTNEGGIGGTTRLLKNVCGLWLVQQCRSAWRREGKEWTWAQLTSLAAESPPLRTLIDPNHSSLVAPHDMPLAIRELAKLTGQIVPDSTGAVIRTALESVAAAIRQTIIELDELLGRRLSRIHVVGGGVQNTLLCQMIADATNRPVVAGPVEATAVGNVLVQLVAREGIVDLRQVRQIVRESFELEEYEPENSSLWDDRLQHSATSFP